MEQTLAKWLSVGFRYTAMHLDRALAPLGLGSSQYKYVLRVCEHPGITQDQFFSMFYVNPSNITRALVALEKDGFCCGGRAAKTAAPISCSPPTGRGRPIPGSKTSATTGRTACWTRWSRNPGTLPCR